MVDEHEMVNSWNMKGAWVPALATLLAAALFYPAYFTAAWGSVPLFTGIWALVHAKLPVGNKVQIRLIYVGGAARVRGAALVLLGALWIAMCRPS
jgi:hypothetical protein